MKISIPIQIFIFLIVLEN